MKISHNGHSLDILDPPGTLLLSDDRQSPAGRTFGRDGHGGAASALVGMGLQPVAEPGAVLPGLDPGAQPLAVARAVAGDHLEKLAPVRLREIVAALLLVPAQVLVRHRQAEVL